MPHPAAAMLRLPSTLLRLSRGFQNHLLRPGPGNPCLPSPPLSARPRYFSSFSGSPPEGGLPPEGVGWTSFDPFTDSLGPVASVPSESDSDDPAEPGTWGVYDPVAGRIVMHETPPPSSPEGDGGETDKTGVEEKGKGARRGKTGQGSWSSVAVPRKSAGKAAKQKVSYVCSNCGEGESQWWGICPSCKATGTLSKFVPGPVADPTEGSPHAVRSWIPQKSKEMVPQSLQDVNKGFDQAEWRIPLYISLALI